MTAAQVAAALTGLRLLLRLDARGLELFEKTSGGFARSFVVAAILLAASSFFEAPAKTPAVP